MGPRASLYAVEGGKTSYPCWESNLGRPAHSLVTIATETSQLIPVISQKLKCYTSPISFLLFTVQIHTFPNMKGKSKVVSVLN
jgi:hypothetical protein